MATKNAGDLIEPSDEPYGDLLRAYVSATVTPTTSVTAFVLTKQSSNGGNIALLGTSGFTAPNDGLYVISYCLRTSRAVSGDCVVQWRLNAAGSGAGGTQMFASYLAIVSGTAGNFSPSATFSYYMDAGDTAEFFHNAGGTMTNFITGGAVTTQVNVWRLPMTPQLT